MLSGPFAAISSRRLLPWPLLLALCVLGSQASPARAQAAHAGLDLRETLVGILAYTRWPVEPNPLRLCVMGHSVHADNLLLQGLVLTGPRPVTVHRPQPELAIAPQCDAVYIATLDAHSWRSLLSDLAGRSVLTVCERTEPCTAGGMVRLHMDPAALHVRFEVNLDAVARSTVRIHPLVLKLGRRSASKEP